MTRLVLLPGMDGTGDLFAPFVEALGPRAQVQVVRYPTSGPQDYSSLTAVASAALPTQEPYVLLGESFSGPIAISLAAHRPPGLMGLVLCCTFARNPRPLFNGMRSVLSRLPALMPPFSVLSSALLGAHATTPLQQAFRQAMAQVPATTMRDRLSAVLGVDVQPALARIQVPMLYLRASDDRVVPRAASALIQQHRPDMRVIDFPAPHFLLQTVPAQAAEAVVSFTASANTAHTPPARLSASQTPDSSSQTADGPQR